MSRSQDPSLDPPRPGTGSGGGSTRGRSRAKKGEKKDGDPKVRVVRRGRNRRPTPPPRPPRPPLTKRLRLFLRKLPGRIHKALRASRTWASDHLDRRHYLTLGATTLLLAGWWWLAPWWTATQAMEAIERADRPGFEEHVDTDALISTFFDEWASHNARLVEDGTPRAISFSVKPEVVQQLERLYAAELDRGPGEDWVLDGFEFDAELSQRVLVPGRDVRLVVRGPGGASSEAWLRLELDGLDWKIVAAPGGVGAMDFILSGPQN